jgi:hypothetical protein
MAQLIPSHVFSRLIGGGNKAVTTALCIEVAPHELAMIVDSKDVGERGPRHIHDYEVPVVQGKAMTRLGDTIDASNHTRSVNPPRQGECRPGHVDLRKYAMVIEIAMLVEAAEDHPPRY